MKINKDVHKHQRLKSRLLLLGYHANIQDAKALRAAMIWCSNILFYNPLDSGESELWSATNQWLPINMTDPYYVCNYFLRSSVVCSDHIGIELMKLGSATRAVAKLKSEKNLDGHSC